MSKAVKASKASVSASVPAPAPASVVETTPVVKTTKPRKTTKTVEQSVTSVVDVAPVVSESPVVETAPVETEPTETTFTELSLDFNAKLQQLSSLISSLKSDYRALEKKFQKEVKSNQKLSSRRKRKTGNRAPSGFVKPTRISDELASFLGKEKGVEMARTSVTRDINAYIRANNLQDKENGRKINPDAKLASLLKLEKTDVLTYFNLQRFMSQHFAKSGKALEASV
jgi:chromatin remodeling complex protein RSC6